MACTVLELIDWLSSPEIKSDDLVGIDEGGLVLCIIRNASLKPDIYYEIGGIPEELIRGSGFKE